MAFMNRGSDLARLLAKPSWLPQTVADLDRHEGFRKYAYPDPLSVIGRSYPAKKYGWGMKPAGPILTDLGLQERNGRPWTVGHGFTGKVTPDTTLTKEQSNKRLEQEALAHVVGLERLVPDWNKTYPHYVQTVLANMAYNLGIARLSQFDATLDLIKEGKFASAGLNLRKSLWYRQVGNRAVELTDRLIEGRIAPEHKI